MAILTLYSFRSIDVNSCSTPPRHDTVKAKNLFVVLAPVLLNSTLTTSSNLKASHGRDTFNKYKDAVYDRVGTSMYMREAWAKEETENQIPALLDLRGLTE